MFGEEVNVCDSYNVTKVRECCDSRLNQLRSRSYSLVSVIGTLCYRTLDITGNSVAALRYVMPFKHARLNLTDP